MNKKTEIKRVESQEMTQNPYTNIIQLAIQNDLDIDKLEKLMAMQKEWERGESEKAYNRSMALVQKEIGAVKANLHNSQTKSKYAGIVDIDAAIRPHYTANGIAISFDTDQSPLPECVRILAFITHESGHKETRHIDIPADGKGAKGGDVMTKTHAVMSATTYGQRALLKMIFNIASGEFDDDGNGAGKKPNNLPGASPAQWSKIVEKFKTGEVDLDKINENFRLTPAQQKELEKLTEK